MKTGNLGKGMISTLHLSCTQVTLLAPMFDAFLAEPATTETHDRVRQGIVLYTGSLAKHIPPEDPRVAQVPTPYPNSPTLTLTLPYP